MLSLPRNLTACLLILAAALLLTSPLARAATLLTNLPSNDGGSGLVSSGTLRAVSFTTPDGAYSIDSVTLRLINFISATDTALLTLRLNDGGAPSSTVFASLMAPTSSSNDAANFVFTPTSAITLAANTLYWIVIAAGSTEETFSWMRSDPVVTPTGVFEFGQQDISDNSGATWSEGSSGPHSFSVTGAAVPEPSAYTLVGLSIAILAFLRFRSRKGA